MCHDRLPSGLGTVPSPTESYRKGRSSNRPSCGRAVPSPGSEPAAGLGGDEAGDRLEIAAALHDRPLARRAGPAFEDAFDPIVNGLGVPRGAQGRFDEVQQTADELAGGGAAARERVDELRPSPKRAAFQTADSSTSARGSGAGRPAAASARQRATRARIVQCVGRIGPGTEAATIGGLVVEMTPLADSSVMSRAVAWAGVENA